MQIDESIFKAYDIRGIYPDQINDKLVEKIGQAFGLFIKDVVKKETPNIVVGRDGRLSSPALQKAFIKGVVSVGCNVVDIDLVSTDALYFAMGKHEYDGAAMISASHNPKEYGGIKMLAKAEEAPKPVSGDWGIPEIKKMVIKDEWPESTEGLIEKKSVMEEYIEYCLSIVDTAKFKNFKVVVDTGNGMAVLFLPELKKKLPIEIVGINTEVDGNFPARGANPLVGEGFNVIGKAVKEHNGDVGLSFDGDADRMFVADENGDIVRPDIILALVAKALLVKNPGASIVYNLTCSHTVPEVVDASGGKAVRSRTGTAYIKDAMINNKAIFGGEVSAHYYFKDNYFADSGLLAFLILMEVLSESGEKLSEMAKKFDVYAYQVEINRRVEDRDAVIEAIKEKYADGKHDELDGLTVEYEDYWFNLRKSNTEPLIRLVVEAQTEERKKQKVEELLAIIGGENE